MVRVARVVRVQEWQGWRGWGGCKSGKGGEVGERGKGGVGGAFSPNIYLYKGFAISHITKMFVDKHCFCYLIVENVEQRDSLFHQPIAFWLAY